MNGGKSKTLGNLREIVFLFTNHFLGAVDLQTLKMLHCAAANLMLKQFLQGGFADKELLLNICG